jgi:hypothetical protein
MKLKTIFFILSTLPLSLYARNYTNPRALPEWDAPSGASIFIDSAHHEIHEGKTFSVEGSSTVTSGQIVEFILKTPDTTEWTHLTFDYSSNVADFAFIAYEGVTVLTTGSTAITPLNMDRNSSNTSSLGIWRSSGTATTSSTIVYGPYTIGASGNPQQRLGGTQSHQSEKILKQNTWYVFRFTNGTTTQVINFRANWYELTND